MGETKGEKMRRLKKDSKKEGSLEIDNSKK
jgi:hypothetical protein